MSPLFDLVLFFLGSSLVYLPLIPFCFPLSHIHSSLPSFSLHFPFSFSWPQLNKAAVFSIHFSNIANEIYKVWVFLLPHPLCHKLECHFTWIGFVQWDCFVYFKNQAIVYEITMIHVIKHRDELFKTYFTINSYKFFFCLDALARVHGTCYLNKINIH